MPTLSKGAWVTCAASDEDVKKCMVLAKSLRRSLTSKALVVFISTKVTHRLRNVLRLEFDHVNFLEEDLKLGNLSLEELAKVSTTNLTFVDECIFLSPKMMVVKNIDGLFNFESSFQLYFGFVENLNIFGVKPTMHLYASFVNAAKLSAATSFSKLLKIQNLNNNELISTTDSYFIHKLSAKLGSTVNPECLLVEVDKTILETIITTGLSNKSLGTFGNVVLSTWLLLYSETEAYLNAEENSATKRGPDGNDTIAIVGMSCRYPGINSVGEFWDFLINEDNAVGDHQNVRWSEAQCGARCLPENRMIKIGFLKAPIDQLDSKFFGISPMEMVWLDPQQRILLEMIWKGLEDAAINPNELRGTNTSVFFGSWMNDYKDILNENDDPGFYRKYMGTSISSAAARVSFILGITGPSIATESGCSSSMVAVHLACRSLLLKETNLALACGVNLIINPVDSETLPMMVSEDGKSKTFDINANGFGRAEGCGVLVLKRLSDAINDNDKIWALIRGTGVSQEGISMSMGTPTVECEALAMKAALDNAKVAPENVTFLECHGTGTPTGDPIEVAAIARSYHSDKRVEPLIIGSVKTNVGHTESCSGITGIMKTVLCMKHEIIPAHLNLTTLNPAINLDAIPAIIPLKHLPWKRSGRGQPLTAGVSSFGITGTDAHAIIQEYCPQLIQTLPSSWGLSERNQHLIKISAKTDEALRKLLEKYAHLLETCEDSFADIAYTANYGRGDFSSRAVLIAGHKQEAAGLIRKNLVAIKNVNPDEDTRGKICFLFPGQGSQYPGMAKQLYETCPVFRVHLEYCEKILLDKYNVSIRDVLWPKEGDSSENLSRTLYSQTSIFCVEYALGKLWESWGIKPDFVLGHSLGEFAAAACAGILSPEDAIQQVAERSRLIDNLPHGKMLVIKANKGTVDAAMTTMWNGNSAKNLCYAAINSSEQTVVSGDPNGIMEFADFCSNILKLKCTVLASSHAFHSKHMDPILPEFHEIAATIKTQPTSSVGYISAHRGSLVPAEDVVAANYWVEHCRNPVLFLKASQTAIELGCKTFIEIGPQPVLTALTMMNSQVPLTFLPSLKKGEEDWTVMLTSLGKLYLDGVPINWTGLDAHCKRKKVSLPHYPFAGKKFWPEMTQSTTGTKFHPLVGSLIPTATSTKVFQCDVSLKELSYMKDHVVGKYTIFPAAGWLEMALMAGFVLGNSGRIPNSHSALPPVPLTVEGLTVDLLGLDENSNCKIQTIVESNDSQQNYSIQFFKLTDPTEAKWKRHASAVVTLLPDAIHKMEFDFDELERILATPAESSLVDEFYKLVASHGLKFGPVFRNIEKVWKTGEELVIKVKVPLQSAYSGDLNYILHPVIIDAMIQSVLLINLHKFSKRLYLPLKIGKVIWFENQNLDKTDENVYIRVGNEKGERPSAQLISTTSHQVLAVMTDVELIETTVSAIGSVLEEQINPTPSIWEETWIPGVGTMQERFSLYDEKEKPFFCQNFVKTSTELFDTLDKNRQEIYKKLNEFVFLNMLKGLYESGWVPVAQQEFTSVGLSQQLEISPEYYNYIDYFLTLFEQKGILKKLSVEEKLWKVISLPLSQGEVDARLKSPQFSQELPKQFPSTALLKKIGDNLCKVFRGIVNPLGILFPPQSTTKEPCVEEFYETYGDLSLGDDMGKHSVKQRLTHWRNSTPDPNAVVRILEVGAGTGAYTQKIWIETLEELEMPFEYTYTDISAGFFTTAEKKFQRHAKSMIYKKLNIEEDPMRQGFTPEYYDYAVASEVIHATRNIRESLENLRVLLRNNGSVDIIEQTKINPIITYIFGSLEGFWRFQDFELRPNHCTISVTQWQKAFEQSGYQSTGVFSCTKGYHSLISCQKVDSNSVKQTEEVPIWVIFTCDGQPICDFLISKLNSTGRKVVVVKRGKGYQQNKNEFELNPQSKADYDKLMDTVGPIGTVIEGVVYCWPLDTTPQQVDIIPPFLYLAQALLKDNIPERFVVITNGAVSVDDTDDLSHYFKSTLWGVIKSLKNERQDVNCRCVDIGNRDETPSGDLMLEVFHEIWKVDKENQVAFDHTGAKFIPRFTQHKLVRNDLPLPSGSDRHQLLLSDKRSIVDLKYGPMELFTLGANEVEVKVKATSLNFRDLLSILKPTESFKDVNDVGTDFAGVVKSVGKSVTRWKIGDVVFGVHVGVDRHAKRLKAMCSHIRVWEEDLYPVPDHLTMNETSGLPSVFSTVYHCFAEVANVTPKDIVLIHTAAGGVGLAAIQFVQWIGARIIATAGSKRKRDYVRSLGVEHVFNSRTPEYSQEILSVTKGRGVNVVLNSITSEGLKEATLAACAKGARFVEMSKLNIWQPADVKALRPDVEYTIVDVSAMSYMELRRLMSILCEFLEHKRVGAVPYTRFDAVNVRQALEYLQKAKHIGKVVCAMPDVKMERGEMIAKAPLFNDRSTYLITGGLGGIGFEVAKWMITESARHILLIGRNPPAPNVQQSIDRLNTDGAHVIWKQVDVGNYEQLKNLLDKVAQSEDGLPPLRGVMHVAGTLSDGLVSKQSWEKFQCTFNPKVEGTLNLHELTKHLLMEHFVLFTSIAAQFGTPGQSNHAAANCFEDTFARYRHSVGLVATAVNWGLWAQVGVATEVAERGTRALSTLQGLRALEYAMKSEKTQLTAINIESFPVFAKWIPQSAVYVHEKLLKSAGRDSSSGALSSTVKTDEFWQAYDSKGDETERLALIKTNLQYILKRILKMDETEVIGDDANFQVMGVDSLMFIELRNAIQNMLGERVFVNVSSLRECSTVGQMTVKLENIFQGVGDVKQKVALPTYDEVVQLLRQDCTLPEHIAPNANQKVVSLEDISTVLITGVNGTLGLYLLRQLSGMKQIKKIYCLVRSRRNEPGKQRLLNGLGQKGLLSSVDMSKVECVEGDVAKPHLGVTDEIWNNLVDSVHAVFHCAARIDHVEYYSKNDKHADLLRSVNVGGTVNILELVCQGKHLKRLYFASTLLAVVTTAKDGSISEDWLEPTDFDGVTIFAYPNSKFASEMLIKQAVDRGIPCSSFRFPLITGDSKTGQFILDQNHFMLRYFYMMKHGIMPTLPFPVILLPADICAEASVNLFFHPDAPPSNVYNLIHPQPNVDDEFIPLAARLGYHIKTVEFSEFAKQLDKEPDDSPIAIFKELYTNENVYMTHYSMALSGWLKQRDDFWVSKKIRRLMPSFFEGLGSTIGYLENDLMYAKKQGWFASKFQM